MDQSPDWQNGLHKLSLRGKYLLESEKLADCKFLVGEKPNQEIISGHKVILAMASPVFERMFFGSIPEKDDPILIPDVQPDTFRSLMKYIYTDEINIASYDKSWEFYYVANKYLMSYCVQQCVQYMKCNISPKNVVKAFQTARRFEVSDLVEPCLKIFSTQTYQVFEHTNLMDIDIETLLTILDQRNLNIKSELHLFNLIQKYTDIRGLNTEPNSDCEMISMIKKAIRKVKFLTLTPKEFVDGPAKSELLTDSEKLAILMSISCPNTSKCLMPKDFSLNIGRKFHHTLIENSETLPKLYCQISCPENGTCYTINENMEKLSFEVDQDILLSGIQMKTQRRNTHRHNRSQHQFYCEGLMLRVLDDQGSILGSKSCNETVKFNSTLEISFDHLIYIEPNQSYMIEVQFFNAGEYNGQYTVSSVEFDEVKLSINSYARPSPIASIVFKYAPS